MSTNYYLYKKCADACLHCTGELEIHICKNLTMFRAYEIEDTSIKSWQDWIAYLATQIYMHEGMIKDEYGTIHSLDYFIHSVNATTLESRRKNYDYNVEHFGPDDSNWLDPQGFDFTEKEFS